MKLSIVMPAYNERRTIREILARVLAVDLGDLEREIVIVDDGSQDGTRDILGELDGRDGVRVLLQPRNMGKGAAVWAGMRASTPCPASLGAQATRKRETSRADARSNRPSCFVLRQPRDEVRSARRHHRVSTNTRRCASS